MKDNVLVPKNQPSEIQPFVFEAAYTIRLLMLDDEPWWVASDVANVLGYRSGPDATRVLDDDEKGTQIVRTPGGRQDMTIINESGLYSLILRSRKPEAKRFKKWVTAEVLPTIRKTGSYSLTAAPAPVAPALPTSYAEALRELANTVEAKAQAEQALALAAPKVAGFERYISSDGVHDLNAAAKLLGWGRNRMLDVLRQCRVLMTGGDQHNVPYQTYVDRRYFVVKARTVTLGTIERVVTTTYVTPRGVDFLRGFLKDKLVVNHEQ